MCLEQREGAGAPANGLWPKKKKEEFTDFLFDVYIIVYLHSIHIYVYIRMHIHTAQVAGRCRRAG